MPSGTRPRVEMIWTRHIDDQPMAGRLRVARAVRDAISRHAIVREHVLLDGHGRRGARWSFSVLWNELRNLPRYGLLPLQCSIYANAQDVVRTVEAVDPDADVIYLDGVRTLVALEQLRRRFPDKRIVVDLDDLMSRRMRLLLKARQPLSPGYLASKLPTRLQSLLGGAGGRLIAWFEAKTLPRVEARICELADAIVLLSVADMNCLPNDGSAERFTIAPAVPLQAGAAPRLRDGSLRFIFVGTDGLTQNRMTIDYLIDLWCREGLTSELVIYGIQTRRLVPPPGVRFAGYVQSLDEIYDGQSIMLSPSFLCGGIKTKVLEAMSRGAPVVGNSATFEALSLVRYPLEIDDETALVALLRDPEIQRPVLESAAREGLEYVRNHHGDERFVREWRQALRLPDEAPGVLRQGSV